MQQNFQAPRRGPIEGPNGRRLIRRVTWRSSTYKLMASLWVFGVFYIVWLIRDIFYLPFSSSSSPATTNGAPSLLDHYVGLHQCGISSASLYTPPQASHQYCQTRDALLSAMSNGGRHGLGAAYTSQGCFYRWYTPSEVCDILQKFDGVVFVGDESLADIYAGFNIILRQDLQTGSLRDWDMSPPQLEKCNCDAQFTSASCLPLRITSSDEVVRQKTLRSPYARSAQVSHNFITVTNSPAPKGTQEKFRQLLAQTETPQKPVAVIQSLSLSTSYSLTTAKNSMDEWLGLAQSSSRITPFLWVGPNAPGHQKPSGDNVHASSWQYTLDAAEAAQGRGIETLGMYNATLQADSWDGMHYGEKVALMQAMMGRHVPYLDGIFG
ncbi:hypothetical protein ATEIFO6365_0001033300 [Aspergillus terreus]|uniref:Uncharacterized protein n=1 Tax=Aspergillus terreus TaxID=33178 RepID=A0A5M3YMY1_ASPTE|nr:hypothetical protein ATETN484_0001025400 [Aspergillus terreus]GFF12110.1 hypothetical protein ATEIFO6365_0001033300 [Aspergillus terreus]